MAIAEASPVSTDQQIQLAASALESINTQVASVDLMDRMVMDHHTIMDHTVLITEPTIRRNTTSLRLD